MPKAYPKEFCGDVVVVARRGEDKLAQIAKDFGVADSCLRNWLRAAVVAEGARPGLGPPESEQLRELKGPNWLLEQENEALRRGLPVPGDQPKMMYPLVRDLAAPGALLRVPVTVTCRVLKFSTQGYDKWLSAPCSQRDYADAHLINAALDLHGDDPQYGYRLLTDELRCLGHRGRENRRVAAVLDCRRSSVFTAESLA